MALIKCSECEKEISDKADACPSCGNPIHRHTVPVEGKIEIEQTSKKWKKTSIFSLLFIIFGFPALGSSIGLGIFLILIGVSLAIVSIVGAWWTNG